MTFSDILTCDSTDIADLISGKLEAQKLYNAMKKILAPTEINILCCDTDSVISRRKRKKKLPIYSA